MNSALASFIMEIYTGRSLRSELAGSACLFTHLFGCGLGGQTAGTISIGENSFDAPVLSNDGATSSGLLSRVCHFSEAISLKSLGYCIEKWRMELNT